MRKRSALALAILLVSSTASASPRVHRVVAGDSLELLAQRYHTTVEALRRLNELEGDLIRVGEELAITERSGGAAPVSEPEAVLRHRVVPGDTLLCIAMRYGVSAERIREDNPRVRVEVGRTLVIRGGRAPATDDAPSAITHRVRPGESLARIARRHAISVAALRALNGDLDPARLRPGTELVVQRGAPSESVGSPSCGSIRGGVQLERHAAFVLRNRARAWTTRRTAERLHAAFDALVRAEPRAPRVRVHDLSLEGGGAIDDHRSHQSGRDADITYYQRRGCGGAGCPLRRVDPSDLDARRQWILFRHWLQRGDAEAIYVDYELQAPLYREADRRGATAEELARWFQYPRGRSHPEGVVRHFPNHRDHLHVRFACDPGESGCR